MSVLQPRIAEGKPWEETNSDGSPNLGSYEYQAILSVVELAHELTWAHELAASSVTGAAPAVPDIRRVNGLAQTLLRICDTTQAAVRSDHRVSRMDSSHTRARGAVREAVKVFPPPFGAHEDVRLKWEQDVTGHAVKLLNLAVAIYTGAQPAQS